MKISTDMYATLFNAITEANEKLTEAKIILNQAQMKAEELFLKDSKKDTV